MNELFKKLDSLFGWGDYEVTFLPDDNKCRADLEVYKLNEIFRGKGCNREVALAEAIGEYESRYAVAGEVSSLCDSVKMLGRELSRKLARLNELGVDTDFYIDDTAEPFVVVCLKVNAIREDHIPIGIKEQGSLRVEIGE